MIESLRYLQGFRGLFGQVLDKAKRYRGRVSRRATRRRTWPIVLEQLEERVCPSFLATDIANVVYTAGPGETNNVTMVPGILSFISDSPTVTIIGAPPSISTNWLSNVSISVGVSLVIDVSIGVNLIPFQLPQSGYFVPSTEGAADFASSAFGKAVKNAGADMDKLTSAFKQAGVNPDDLAKGLGGIKIDLGDGNDTADVSAFHVNGITVLGGDGNDTIYGSGGADSIDGGTGNDSLVTNGGADTITGGTGDDTISIGSDGGLIDGGPGSDQFIVNTNYNTTNTLIGGDGQDQLFVSGTDANDVIKVTTSDQQVQIDVNGTVATYNIPNNDVEQIHVHGGLGYDKLIIKDAGLGTNDTVQFYRGPDGTSGLIKVGSNTPFITFDGIEEVNPLDGPLTRADGTSRVITFAPDPFESTMGNNTRQTATHLGAGEAINVDPSIDPAGDVDFYQFVASDTGMMDFRTFFKQNPGLPGNGNIDTEVQDSNGNVLGSSTSNSDGKRVEIPVVKGQIYYLKVFGATPDAINTYEMSVINTPAPIPSAVVLDPTDDSGISGADQRTDQTTSDHYFIHADLLDFADQGIAILTPAQAAAGVTPGAAVQVFDNGTSVGFASAVPGTDNTIFEITFNADLTKYAIRGANAAGPLGYDGFRNFVTAAVTMFDGQKDSGGTATQESGRTHLSDPLSVTFDNTAPIAPSSLDLLASSDTGTFSNDNVTKINTPTFSGIAEANSRVVIWANGVDVGEVLVGTDATDGTLGDGLGTWKVAANQLTDGTYNITASAEDSAGNISQLTTPLSVTIDTTAPNTPYLDLVDASDSGRSNTDNITNDNTPTVTTTADDVGAAGLNLAPHDIRYRIFDRVGTGPETLLVDGFPTLTTSNFFTDTLSTLADGVHNLMVQVEDRAGNISHPFFLQVTIDTVAPAAPTIMFDPASDTGVIGQPATFADNVTSATVPGFVGTAEANSIVRLFADATPITSGVLDASDVAEGLTVAVPSNGNQAFPGGQWQQTVIKDLNNPKFFPFDGLREMGVTAEDLAGNVSAPSFQNTFIDTRGPQVTGVQITSSPTYDLFDPKPSAGPTPRTDSLTIRFQDFANRDTASFPGYAAILAAVASQPGHYVLRGDANGIIPINTVTIVLGPDINGTPATATAVLTFSSPLPDDRFTLTVDDSIVDPTGNKLDGESNAKEPQATPNFPTGDGVPGGNFVARFTIDSRPEIGSVGSGGITIDINGNMQFDPTNTDSVNRDLTFEIGLNSDRDFSGKFNPVGATTQDGFDRLGAYGLLNNKYRWLLDFNNDGRPDYSVVSGLQINGTPISGDFSPTHVGDEIGLFDGKKWYLDTNGNNNIDAGDKSFTGNMTGVPFTGDFDGDGKVDLATYSPQLRQFQFNLSSAGPLDGNVDYTISFSNPNVPLADTPLFPGVLTRPFAGDFNLDGITDIGLMVPNRDGASPSTSAAEWYIFQSIKPAGYVPNGTASTLNHQFAPSPLGSDLYAQFGTNVSVPIVGNFDPPIVGSNTVTTNPVVQTGGTPTVSIAPIDDLAAETISGQPRDTGTFRVTRTGDSTVPLTVNLARTGTATIGRDFTLTIGGVTFNNHTVLIPKGQSSIDLIVTPVNDNLAKAAKTISLTLGDNAQYVLDPVPAFRAATVNLAKNGPVISVAAIDSSAAMSTNGIPTDTGIFRISRTGSLDGSLTVNFQRSGTATFNSNFQMLVNGVRVNGSSVVIAAGQSFVDVIVMPLSVKKPTASKSVVLTLSSSQRYNLDDNPISRLATITIAGN